MKRNVGKKVARRKRRILMRLERARERRFIRGMDSTPVIGANAMPYELSERTHAIGSGGIGMMLKLAKTAGLVSEIDRRVHLLKHGVSDLSGPDDPCAMPNHPTCSQGGLSPAELDRFNACLLPTLRQPADLIQ